MISQINLGIVYPRYQHLPRLPLSAIYCDSDCDAVISLRSNEARLRELRRPYSVQLISNEQPQGTIFHAPRYVSRRIKVYKLLFNSGGTHTSDLIVAMFSRPPSSGEVIS